MQNSTLPLCVLLESSRFAAGSAAVNTVGCLTIECFETSSVVFLSPCLVHKICKLMFLFLFLGRQTSREALAFILITQEYIQIFFFFLPVMIPILPICEIGSKAPCRQAASCNVGNYRKHLNYVAIWAALLRALIMGVVLQLSF